MLKLLQSIVDIIVTIVQFFLNVFDSLLLLLTNLPTYIAFLISSIGLLPAILIPFATATISIYVIFLILNRGK